MKSFCLISVLTILSCLSYAQQITPAKEQIIAMTPEWKGERSPDGRPIVPDKLLSRLKNISLEDYILYELHTGTFTPEGTFAGLEDKLDYLKMRHDLYEDPSATVVYGRCAETYPAVVLQ